MLQKILNFFISKNGKSSKTAFFLSLATIILLSQWILCGCFAGVTLLGWWLVPEFNVGAATAVMGILGTLYVANHSKKVMGEPTPEDLEEARAKVDRVSNAIRGSDD